MQLKKPDPRVRTVWRLRLLPAAALLLYLSIRFWSFSDLIWWIFTGLWLSAFLFFMLIYFPLRYRRLSYALHSRALIVHAGVIDTRIKAVPLHAVLYASVLSTPLLRRFGIRSLVLYMAGSRLTIPGLTAEDANALREKLTFQSPDGGISS